jgi:uroporphyrinogen decarboxylase
MTGRERILKALALGQPDQVPIFELGFNESSIVKLGKLLFGDVSLPERDLPDLAPDEAIRLLDVLCGIVEALDLDAVSTVFLTGRRRYTDDLVRDRYGIVYRLSSHGEPYPVDGPIHDASDLARFEKMEPDPLDFLMLQYVVGKIGRERAHVFTIPATFRWSWSLRGAMERLLLDYAANPELAQALARVATDFCNAAVEKAIDLGADVICLEGDLAHNPTTLMSPAHYRRFLKPYHQETVALAHARGVPIIKHSDGNLWPILDDLIEVGFDGIHPIQPQCMDIGEVKRHLAGRACVLGNIDCMYLLPSGSEEEVVQSVKETLAKAAPGGGYIASSSNSIHPGCRPENYAAMVRAVRKYGVYPSAFS